MASMVLQARRRVRISVRSRNSHIMWLISGGKSNSIVVSVSYPIDGGEMGADGWQGSVGG